LQFLGRAEENNGKTQEIYVSDRKPAGYEARAVTGDYSE
jgi:hypothetical protein